MRLLDLPPEILTAIVSLLDVPSAMACQRVCKRLNDIASSELVLKTLCHRIRFLDADQTIEDLRKPAISAPSSSNTTARSDGHTHSGWKISGRDEADLVSYKTLLAGSWRLHHAKHRADLSHKGGTNLAHSVEPWRIKIDHIDNVILATSTIDSRMYVIDMETGHPLSTEFDPQIRAYTHLEADQGWIVYTLTSTTFRISCFERNTDVTQPRRGHLVSQGTLHAIHPVAAYRLIFPYLLVGSRIGYATLYDITTKDVVIDIRLHNATQWVSIRYVEFDQDFIWVLIGPEQFAVGTLHTYCRHTGRFLWALSPLSETLRRRHSLYRFSPPSQSVIRGQPLSNAAQNKTVAPGRREQVVTKSASRVMPQLEGWDAIHPDAKTGCLCLLSSQMLVVIPEYKTLVNFHEEQNDPARQTPILMLGDAPAAESPLMSQDPNEPPTYLAVSDGRAAFMAKNGVALVDLEKLLTVHYKRDELQQLSSKESHYHEGNCVNLYTSPFVFHSNMTHSSCLALTSTKMAWVGDFQKVEARPVPAELRDAGINCDKVYKSEQWPTVTWIDFNQLRTKEPDKRRLEQEKLHKECLKACKTELERRNVANQKARGRDPWPYIMQMPDDEDESLDIIADLLGFGKFSHLSLWIDWDAAATERGELAAAELHREVDDYERESSAADWIPLSLMRPAE